MPNILKGWKDFATVEDWITNTQVADSGVVQSIVANVNDLLINPFIQTQNKPIKSTELLYKLFFKPNTDYKGEYGFDAYSDELATNLTHIYDSISKTYKIPASEEKQNLLKKEYSIITMADESTYIVPYLAVLKDQSISLQLDILETKPMESVTPNENIRIKKESWFEIFCDLSPIEEKSIEGIVYWEINYRKLRVKTPKGTVIQIKVVEKLTKTHELVFLDSANRVVGSLNFVANEIYKLPIKLVGLVKNYGGDESKQDVPMNYLKEQLRNNYALEIGLDNYLNNYSLNQACIQCEFETDADGITVHKLTFDEILWEKEKYYDSSSNTLRDPDATKSILDKIYEHCLLQNTITADYRGIVLFLSTVKGDDEGGKGDLSEGGKSLVIFYSNLVNYPTYVHEIGHVLGLTHSFYTDENKTNYAIKLKNSIENLEKAEKFIAYYTDKQQKSGLTEEEQSKLTEVINDKENINNNIKKYYYNTSISKTNKFRFTKNKTANLMDYTSSRNSFFYYQWQIMQNEVSQYYDSEE